MCLVALQMAQLFSKLPVCKVSNCAMLLIVWRIYLPSCLCHGANAYQVAHCKVLMHAKLPIARCHLVPMFPITWAPCEQNCPSEGAIVCIWFPSQGAVMCQGSYLKVPSCAKRAYVKEALCAKGAQHMLHLCAKLPTSSRHCVPILPIVRCHRVPMLPIRMCHHVPRDVIAWFTHVPGCLPQCAKVAKSRCHRVSSCPSNCAIVCQVAHRKVPLRAK